MIPFFFFKCRFVNLPTGNCYWLQLRQIQERTCWYYMDDSGQESLHPVRNRKLFNSVHILTLTLQLPNNSHKRLVVKHELSESQILYWKVKDCTRFWSRSWANWTSWPSKWQVGMVTTSQTCRRLRMTEMVFMIFSLMAYTFSGSSGGFSSTSAAIL